MAPPRVITYAIAASVGIHLALMVLVPGMQVRLPVTQERLVEVEMTESVEEPDSEQLAPPPPQIQQDPPAREPPEPAAAPTPLAADRVAALEQVLTLPATAPPPAALPPLRLPERKVLSAEDDTLAWAPPPPPRARPLAGAVPGGEQLELPPGPDHRRGEELARSLLQALEQAPVTPTTPTLEVPPALEIEGPVGRERKVVEEPSFPQVRIRHSTDVRIKFFVSPRGEVLRAFPVERGDAELERAAMEYVKAFAFNPLPHGDDREQWGTIRVRFRLH